MVEAHAFVNSAAGIVMPFGCVVVVVVVIIVSDGLSVVDVSSIKITEHENMNND